MKELATTKEEMLSRMNSCEQTSGTNMLEHGYDVHDAYQELVAQLEGGERIVDLPP